MNDFWFHKTGFFPRPVTWEGYLTLSVFAALIIWALTKYQDNPGYMMLQVIVLSVILLIVMKQWTLREINN